MPHSQSPERLDFERSALLVIDVQQKLVPAIAGSESILQRIDRLIVGAKLTDVPTATTLQYPQGLGPIVSSLAEHFTSAEEKTDFSAAVCRDALDDWAEHGRDQIVVAGIETHICVLQTVLDLIAEGQRPFVVVDAVGSRHQIDHEVAIQRMRDAGATVITSESALFEWMSSAKHPNFKQVSQLVR